MSGFPRRPERARPGRDEVAIALLHLPAELEWTWHRGEEDPPLGWWSEGLGRRRPSTTLVGRGELHRRMDLRTLLLLDVTGGPDHV